MWALGDFGVSALGLGWLAQPLPRMPNWWRKSEITVTATRTAQNTFDVPNAVSVITAEEIEENLVTDIKDLVRFEPGVSGAK